MELFWWLTVIVLMAIGLVGTVLPFFPGTTVILAAAVIHRLILGPERSLGWTSLGLLVLLTLISYALDFAASYVGAKRFGATRWGMLGAAVGALIGMFFGIVGLCVGPVIGAILGEIIGGKHLTKASRAGWGALLGNLAGMLAKLIIAFAMVIIFLLTAPSPV